MLVTRYTRLKDSGDLVNGGSLREHKALNQLILSPHDAFRVNDETNKKRLSIHNHGNTRALS